MQYFDTNILVYAIINQIPHLKEESLKLIEKSIETETFIISPLVLSEFVFTCNKLKLPKELIEEYFNLYKQFAIQEISLEVLEDAFNISKKIGFGRNINDIIHLILAEKKCDILYTADGDFKKLQDFTNLDIRIIK